MQRVFFNEIRAENIRVELSESLTEEEGFDDTKFLHPFDKPESFDFLSLENEILL